MQAGARKSSGFFVSSEKRQWNKFRENVATAYASQSKAPYHPNLASHSPGRSTWPARHNLSKFYLTTPFYSITIVLTMNNISPQPLDDLLFYQTRRIQHLMEETLQCCEMRMAFLSKKFSLPQAEFRCLLLFRGEHYLTVKNIAQKLEVAKSRVTKIIAGLMQKKLVHSIDDPQDGRVKLISLTSAGQKKCQELSDLITEIHELILLELEPEQRKTVLSSLELLRASMEAIKRRLT
jgi:DNA-binding MarR family transcriptional regulator